MNLIVTGAARPSGKDIDLLKNAGHDLVLLQNESDMISVPYDQIEGVVCNGLFLYHPIEKFKALRFIQLTSAGYDRVPMEYVAEHKIDIYNARGVYSIPMAEFAVSSVLGVYKQWDYFRRSQREHMWNKHRGLLELYGKTVCIVGCGNVGTECAKRFSAFGCKIIGVDIITRDNPLYDEMIPVSNLAEVLPCADVIVLTLPLTRDTKNLLTMKEFDLFRDGCVLVNISRGAVVNTADMLNALRVKDIAAVLDVFEDEPLPADHPLWDMDNVFITPHNSFVGEGNAERLWSVIFNNLGIISP